MSVGSVLIGLQAWRRDGRGVTTAELLDQLNIKPDEVEATRADGGAWASGMVYFAVVRLSAFAHIDASDDAGAQSEAFSACVVKEFRDAGRFLDRRAPEVTAGLRVAGLSLRFFVEIRMDQDQMELELPRGMQCGTGPLHRGEGRHGVSRREIGH